MESNLKNQAKIQFEYLIWNWIEFFEFEFYWKIWCWIEWKKWFKMLLNYLFRNWIKKNLIWNPINSFILKLNKNDWLKISLKMKWFGITSKKKSFFKWN